MTALTLYPYQREWLESRARFKLGMFARQTGKSFTSTLGIVDDMLDAEAQGRRSSWVMLSRGERQARELMREGVAKHLTAYRAAFEACEHDWGCDRDGLIIRALEIELPGGSRVTALPANPDTARGYSRNVYLDEFAFHADSREIWRAVFPIVSRGFKCWITSTPNGKANKFFELATSADGAWEVHRCDIHRAAAEGYPVDVDALRRGLCDEDAWRQEYELEWLDEASAWLSYDLISACESDGAGDPAQTSGGQTCIGVDIGVRGDLWVAWVLEKVGDVFWTREVRVLRRATFAEHDATLDELIHRWRPLRVAMDQTGLGEKPVEDARRRYGSRVEGVLFTQTTKHALATVIRDAFEDRRVRIPIGDQELRRDLHKVQCVTSATGAPRFIAERNASGHADRFWALALALSAASTTRVDLGVLELSGETRASSLVDLGVPSGRLSPEGF